MAVTLDGQRLFDDIGVEIEKESLRKGSIEKAVPGLDGVISIDMGSRSRKIRQSGTLRASSKCN